MINIDNIDNYVTSAACKKMRLEELYLNAKKNYEYLKDCLEDADEEYENLLLTRSELQTKAFKN